MIDSDKVIQLERRLSAAEDILRRLVKAAAGKDDVYDVAGSAKAYLADKMSEGERAARRAFDGK